MKLMEMMDQSSDFVGMLVKKLAPPLVTLLSAEPEIQYVALRNINLVVQKRLDCCMKCFAMSSDKRLVLKIISVFGAVELLYVLNKIKKLCKLTAVCEKIPLICAELVLKISD